MPTLVKCWLEGIHSLQNLDSNKEVSNKISKQDYESDQTFDASFLYSTVRGTLCYISIEV